ncbi:dihydroorotase [Halopseudomonas xinjiangensis]|uniref:Dihydroorotase n=1 Tax=Halopseudomonas xinjiangensis TaxID=487184 RepID=A0A1H1X5Q8_9GAMM|nr:dihydroorotase [Halopseudomonas xinjiangensis]SDT04657.1 dihydroorotase [Halopseudomonas xinjiangensis]
MRVTIEGARVIDPATQLDQITDIHIDNGLVHAIGLAPEGFVAQQVFDARGLIAAPGLVDLNASLREPGQSHKGTIASETRAAASGGVTTLCCPPDTRPVLDTPAVAELIFDRTERAGQVRVFPIAALTRGLDGEHLSELVALRDAGCVAFTQGLAPMKSNRILRRALEYAAGFNLPVIFTPQDPDLAEGGMAHEGPTASRMGLVGIPEAAETVALARDLLLIEQTGVRAHFSGLTSARAMDMLADARARGLPVTADVAMYQLLLCDEQLEGFSSLLHVQPPLRSASDRSALREAVKLGLVQAIASHHRPHEPEAKRVPFAASAPGISSVEILLPLAMNLVADGVLELPAVLARLTCGPAAALGLPAGRLAPGDIADIVLFDPVQTSLIGHNWLSRGANCPFLHEGAPGVVTHTFSQGKLVYQSQQVV